MLSHCASVSVPDAPVRFPCLRPLTWAVTRVFEPTRFYRLVCKGPRCARSGFRPGRLRPFGTLGWGSRGPRHFVPVAVGFALLPVSEGRGLHSNPDACGVKWVKENGEGHSERERPPKPPSVPRSYSPGQCRADSFPLISLVGTFITIPSQWGGLPLSAWGYG